MNLSVQVLRFSCSLVLLCGICFGQEAPQPFASVDAASKRNGMLPDAASGPFQAVRTQLGENFEPELWKYLSDNNVDRHFSIDVFLLYSGYLHGNPPMPDLARRIELKILSLVAGKADLSSQMEFVSASMNVAVVSAELGMMDEARQHKSDAEKMIAADKKFVMAVPAMEDYDRCVYASIGDVRIADPTTACLPQRAARDPKVTMIEVGEVAPDKVLSKPAPRWPKATKGGAACVFKVRVLIDEAGNVESAETLSGPSAIQDAALAAARKARFQKTIYQGIPVKVRGWVEYTY